MSDEILDNGTIWKLYSPKPNPWFSSEIIYEGWGVATFENPPGTLEGETKIVVDEAGNLDVVMEYEKLNTDAMIYGDGSMRFLKFLQGDLSKGNMVGIGTDNINQCSKLTVQTASGVFTSDGKIYYQQGLGFDSQLRLYFAEGTYTEKIAGHPKYWVLPLINFVSTFHMNLHPLLTQHPLRLYLTPTVPEFANEEQKNMALLAANRANLLIGFYFGTSVGYIQPVLDYGEKKEKLKSEQTKQSITALMISEVSNQLDAFWFPYDYTNLMSFAIGIEVSAPWIEFRDDSGSLVSRKHIMKHNSDYKKEYAVIDEMIHSGLGSLLSLASNSPEFGKSYFSVLIGHLVRLQSLSRQIEDHMDLLCRTFDMLSEEFEFSTQNLAKSLPAEYRTQIDTILEEARKKVERLSKTAGSEFQPTLKQIESRIPNAKNKDRAFGLAVMELLKKFELPDAIIMEKFYELHAEFQGKSWIQSLTIYRGAAVHTGYFSHEKYDIQDVLVLEDHLHDILTRIALKILAYQGSYQPRMTRYNVNDKTIRWVDENTSPAQLGYKRPII